MSQLRTLGVVLLIGLFAGAQGTTQTYTIKTGDRAAALDVPKHDLVTVNNQTPDFLFYSVKAGYEQPEDGGPYAPVPAEMSITLVNGKLDEAMKMKRSRLGESQKVSRELNRDGQVIWLIHDELDDEDMLTRRALQFIPADAATLVIDASATRVRGMPAGNVKLINRLLVTGLKTVKLDGTPVATRDIQQHVLAR